MKSNKFIVLTIFSSIFLYSTPIKEPNPIDKLIIEKTIKQDENSSIVFEKFQSDLEEELTGKQHISKDIHHKRFLRRFYRQNSYMPLWFKEDKLNHDKLSTLFKEIENDLTLNPKDKIYKRYKYISQYIKQKNIKKLHIELQLTELYFEFLNHILYGSINWKKFSSKLTHMRKRGLAGYWVRYKPKYSVSELLLQPNIHNTIEEITPKRFGYRGLLKSLKILKNIKAKGGWKELPYFKKLELGDKGLTVVKLRERLEASGDLNICQVKPENLFEKDEIVSDSIVKFQPRAIFDSCLEDAVKKFQARHGLESDGIVGSGTRKTLNITLASKIRTVILNLDRIKWLPREDDKRYIVVNIPEYILHFIENKKEIETIKVIVGNKKHHTPIFREKISYIVLNPYWKVPAGIVRKEIIPHMIRNRNYIRKEGLEIRRTWFEKSARINPNTIFWEDYYYGGIKFPYRIMQPPGPKNALGKIIFKFPNRFNVYLHDTPTKRLFKKTRRAYSHGCIRVSEPQKLFETIASFNNIDINKSKKILRGRNKVQLNIKNKIPVYIIYLTAGYNIISGKPEFRDDIYRYDKMQMQN
jgi:murein L,D-transpeptidase YcbB/YkuD